MKKIITFILIAMAFAMAGGMCPTIGSANYVDALFNPLKSGEYKTLSIDNKFSNGSTVKIGDGFVYTKWENNLYLTINCKVTNINICYQYKYNSAGLDARYEYTLDCTVSDKIQFYSPKIIYYKDVKGYRNDGTLQWSRESAGSTDITCYSKNGLSIVKRVNNPGYCK